MAYPPKPIKRKALWFSGYFVLLYLIVLGCYYYWGSNNDIISQNLMRLNIFSFLILKAILFLSEIAYRKLYYNPDGVMKLLLWVIKMDNWPYFIIITMANSAMFFNFNNIQTLFNFTSQDGLIILFFVATHYFKWGDCPLNESYRLEQSNKFSIGASMAKGFYHGYLKMILEDENIIKCMNNFVNSENIKNEEMPERKLFVVMPSSLKIPNIIPTLNPKDENIEHIPNASLSVNRNRCMVMKRSYKCSMYVLKDEGKKYYLPFEGATPLKTFYEACERDPTLKEFTREIVSSFYYTLSALVEDDHEMKPYVELVYYDDTKYPDLDQVLLQRLKYLKHQRKLKRR